ncbi:hypothetical protein MKJ01_15950 [Chryseobacterium sp. SSA4.19]|uniref:hypothetical protein n=1 Tax=Chryseobacterium sp. SSA4.19 TaxID=2919915 RepID=UPI001F4E9656|nr:hypothetical protein [Chryseobacterium sp. SSA4.19]MCJ8155258.1 hypothetical protein [Chryseobacterium sp. SSA4.19]
MKKLRNRMKNLIYYYRFILFIMLWVSCKNESNREVFIEKLSAIQNGLPSPYFNYYLYFKTDNDKILEANIDSIYAIYKIYYIKKYQNFNSYLISIMEGRELVREIYINNVKETGDYLLNVEDINKNIEEMSVEEIERKYLKSEKQSFILATGNVTAMESRNILYKMFFNGYIISFSDYGGYYLIKKYESDDFK